MDESEIFVAKDGKDSYDGLTPRHAKLTVAGAVAALPRTGSGGNERAYGTVKIGSGNFVEAGDLEVNSDISYIGVGTGSPSGPPRPSVIRLDPNAEAHLFAPTPGFTDWAHHVLFRDLTLDGNEFHAPGDYDLLRLYRPGFNCHIQNVFFRFAPRYGINPLRAAVNLSMNGCTGAACREGWFYFKLIPSSNLSNVSIVNTQLDDCGDIPIQIVNTANGIGNVISIVGLKTETRSPGKHEYVIEYDPESGNHASNFHIANVSAFRQEGGPAVIHQKDNSGPSASFNLQGPIAGWRYDKVFVDDKNGFSSVGVDPAEETGSVLPGAGYFAGPNNPAIELDGGVQILVTTGNPENKIKANPGSIALDRGGEDSAFYVKESGTGETGWVAK